MQLDMHYYGTYAMARAAGLRPAVCKTAATASQFVDDNAAKSHIEFQDGGRIDAQATAHHVADVIANRDPEDQRQIWVPFHFLPGNEGDSFSEIEQVVAPILAYPAKKADRIKKWRNEAKNGGIGPKVFEIPLYDTQKWMKQSADLNSSENSVVALRSHLYRFYQAASIHRHFVLRELLPDNKLIVA